MPSVVAGAFVDIAAVAVAARELVLATAGAALVAGDFGGAF